MTPLNTPLNTYLPKISIKLNKNPIPLLYLLYNCNISMTNISNIVFKRRIDFVSFKLSNNWFMKLICRFKKPIDH